ncbi:TPA: hypothetical protein ACGZ99_000651 [Elizabethkingia anophelis]
MKATFFIIPESFQYKGEPQSDIERKIENFAIDLRRIKETPINDILCHSDVYNVEFFKNKTISDILNVPKHESIDRDVFQHLRIIWELKESTDSIDDIKEVYIPGHNENECYGLVAFNQIDNILPEYQLIYGIDSWFKFRRFFLGVYPKNVDFFIDECNVYFENLFFHEDNKISLKRLFPNCVKRVIYHLSELNDKFPQSKTIPYNRIDTLGKFNSTYSHDGQEASPQGDIKKKKDLTFNFVNEKGSVESMYCELHLKLSHDDHNVFSNDRRIYFHEGNEKIHEGKILIGHIGKHL